MRYIVKRCWQVSDEVEVDTGSDTDTLEDRDKAKELAKEMWLTKGDIVPDSIEIEDIVEEL